MQIVRAPARLRPFRLTASSTRGKPDGQPPDQVATVELRFEIEADDDIIADDVVRHVFPFADEIIKTIAGREEDDRRGTDLFGRGRVADLLVSVHQTKEDTTADVFAKVVFSVTGRPRLAIDEDGKATLHLKTKGVLTTTKVAALAAYVDADVYVSTAMYLPLFDAGEKPVPIKDGKPDHASAEPKPPKSTKRGAKGKGADDVEVDGVLVTLGKKERIRAEGAAMNARGRYDLDGILKAARMAARIEAMPGAESVAVTTEHIDGAIDALEAAAAAVSAEGASDTMH